MGFALIILSCTYIIRSHIMHVLQARHQELVIENCDSAIAIDPRYVKALLRRFKMHFALGHQEEALLGMLWCKHVQYWTLHTSMPCVTTGPQIFFQLSSSLVSKALFPSVNVGEIACRGDCLHEDFFIRSQYYR